MERKNSPCMKSWRFCGEKKKIEQVPDVLFGFFFFFLLGIIIFSWVEKKRLHISSLGVVLWAVSKGKKKDLWLYIFLWCVCQCFCLYLHVFNLKVTHDVSMMVFLKKMLAKVLYIVTSIFPWKWCLLLHYLKSRLLLFFSPLCLMKFKLLKYFFGGCFCPE